MNRPGPRRGPGLPFSRTRKASKTRDLAQILAAAEWLIKWPFTMPLAPWAAWLAGLIWLGLLASVVGEFTLAIVYRVNRGHIKTLTGDMINRHNQSVHALMAGDKGSFKGINKLANQAFGKVFFNQIAMGMASLWPAFLGAAWLDGHFSGVVFFSLPWLGHPVGWLPQWVVVYISCRLAFGRFKRKIPFIANTLQMVEEAAPTERMHPIIPPPIKNSDKQ